MSDKWQALNNERPELLQKLKDLFLKNDSFVTNAKDFLGDSSTIPIAEIKVFLNKASSVGFLDKTIEYYCPFEDCEHFLSETEREERICTNCGQSFVDSPQKKPIEKVSYIRHALSGRDVRWFLALHGMNTRGSWQEEFNWRVATTFGRSIPVAIYKYGIIRFSVLFPCSQKRLVKKLYKRFISLSGDTQDNGLGSKPDVIAHSFGTWMIGHLLNSYPEIKIGRVILLGSILRPDFNWKKLIKNGQVEAVLNHFSRSDIPVQITQLFIPDSGPSGYRGFDDPNVINVEAPKHSHSAYFKIDKMKKHFEKVWWSFLQKNINELNDFFPVITSNKIWRQSVWILRGRLFPWLILIALACVLKTIELILFTGFNHIFLFQ